MSPLHKGARFINREDSRSTYYCQVLGRWRLILFGDNRRVEIARAHRVPNNQSTTGTSIIYQDIITNSSCAVVGPQKGFNTPKEVPKSLEFITQRNLNSERTKKQEQFTYFVALINMPRLGQTLSQSYPDNLTSPFPQAFL